MPEAVETREPVPLSRLAGMTLAKDRDLPDDEVYLMKHTAIVSPLTFWRLTHEGRYPWYSRCSRGTLELERDRRRRARAA